MKVQVKKYLNCRSDAPSTDAPCFNYRSPGETLDIDDIVIGSNIDGNSVWYHCQTDGMFYWSGGIDQTSELLSARRNQQPFSPEEQLQIYESAVNELAPNYRSTPGFKGLAAGYKFTEGRNTGQLALIFFVTEKTNTPATPVPAIINYRGFPLATDINQIGPTNLQDIQLNIPPDAGQPYMMGGSLSEINKEDPPSFGTRTLLVSKFDKDYLLTCYHVACSSLFEQGTYKLQNNTVDVNIPSHVISPAFPHSPFRVKEGQFGDSFDYALIDMGDTVVVNTLPNFDIRGIYNRSEIRQAFLQNRPLAKYGAASRDTTGTLIAFHSEGLPVNDTPPLTMSGLIAATDMSENGDSGAPVIDTTNNKLVGFIVAKHRGDTPLTYILPIAELQFQFSIIPKL